MTDGPTNDRRDRQRAEREATAVLPLRPKVPVRIGSHRPTVERNREALRRREEGKQG